ncbi:hypothetical protein AVV30_gp030 [Vibrio phage phi 1]|uniref:Uncharacterized protein n=1 Tax=Vibrio phage phi 1 TaxID=1589297 RepID=A0A0B5H8I8_9CAUD|nr:hypothetical protein AVV30_gp030 [Vibrio phage phi 1]AJF40688.1 hypothetical protein SBVP1_0030 [Vibrio phage phi 1]
MKLLPTYKYLQVPFSESTVWFSFNNSDVGIVDISDPVHNAVEIDHVWNDVNNFPDDFVRRNKQDN